MPEFTGVDVLRALRSASNTRLRTLPVVVLSNGHVQDLIDSVGPLGVQKIFVKMQTPPNVLIEGTKETLNKGLKKLEEYNSETLGSETALKNLLNDLG
jgi:DNA-binding NarL/FixJ family response regulator